jgi:hypothetical protein
MSKNNNQQATSTESHEEESGTAGLERTSGTTSTSTGKVERTGVAPAMPDTGSIDHAHSTTNSTKIPSDK